MASRLDAERQLAVLNAVSAVANEATDLAEVMQRSLELVCDLLALRTGWVYLLEEGSGEPTLSAALNLPPVFRMDPERFEGLCWCVQSLIENDPKGAANVNTISCSRLWRAVEGNPEGIEYHASIPFFSHGRQMGIMNVAHSDWRRLDVAELALLASIGNQLGMAVERARLLGSNAADAVRAERDRLARELHDTVMQQLTGIGLQLETADAVLESHPDRARARISTALRMTQEALAEARAAVENLDPSATRHDPLWKSLPDLCGEFASLYGIAVRCEVHPAAVRPPDSIEGGIYRVVREGLNNVVKHAGATKVTVRLRTRPNRLSLLIEDDGRGFARARAVASVHGYGLHSMRRRTQMMGGRFRLKTAPGQGTRVEVSVPLPGA
jgi:two-component system NarL family sensor kinase